MKQGGWTIVEAAIVLMVVALLMVAILVGKSMMGVAAAKSVLADFDGVAAAVQLYRDRYRALPGDDPNAAGRWAGASSGNGDGRITGVWNALPSSPPSSETHLFWWHLRLAGFMNGKITGPEAALAPGSSDSTRAGVQEGAFNMTGVSFCMVLPDKIAAHVDRELDDGKPNTGSVRAALGDFGLAVSSAPAANYTEAGDTPQTYVVCRQVM